MKRKILVSIFMVLIMSASMLMIAFAESASYSKSIPCCGIHVDITGYKTRDSLGSVMSNTCTKSESNGITYDFYTWVDQKDAGQVTGTLQIKSGQSKNYSMKAYPAVGAECKGRACTIGVLSAAMSVGGTLNFR